MSDVATLRERIGLITVAYVHRAGFAFLAAIGPAVIATRVSASWPGGDLALFEPGGVIAVETQRLDQRYLGAVFSQSIAILLVGVLTGALVLGALIDGFTRRRRIDAGDIAEGATRALGTVVLLLGAGFFAELLAGAVVGGAAAKGIDALHLSFRGELGATIAATVLTLAVVAAVGVLRDLACTAAVLDARRFGGAVSAAWRSLRPSIAWSYTWRALLSLTIAAAGWFAGSLVLPALLHQLVIFALVVVHASWIRVAVATIRASGDLGPSRLLVTPRTPSYAPPPSVPPRPAFPSDAGSGGTDLPI